MTPTGVSQGAEDTVENLKMCSLQIAGNTEHNTTQPKPSKNFAMMCAVDSSENPVLWGGGGQQAGGVYTHGRACFT